MEGPPAGVKSAVAFTVMLPPVPLAVVRSSYWIVRLPVKLLKVVPVLLSVTLLGKEKSPPNGEMTACKV